MSGVGGKSMTGVDAKSITGAHQKSMTSSASSDEGLRRVLLANAAFSGVGATALLILGERLAPLFGLTDSSLLTWVGLSVLPFVGLLCVAAGRQPLQRRDLIAFVISDAAWVLGSAMVLVLFWDSITIPGRWLVAAVAIVVDLFATLQLRGLRRERSGPLTTGDSASTAVNHSGWVAIARSWMALKTWVKIWLVFLNAVFLVVLEFTPDPVADWTIFAYAASAPLLLALAVDQRGLTRLLGIAHLVTWVPLVVYLLLRLTGDLAGPLITPATRPALFSYVLVLLATLVVCLALDAYDVVRWMRGERLVIGSPDSARIQGSRSFRQ